MKILKRPRRRRKKKEQRENLRGVGGQIHIKNKPRKSKKKYTKSIKQEQSKNNGREKLKN